MATVKELIRRTNRITDDEWDNIDLIDWFNQCQAEALAHVLYLPATADLPLSPSGVYTLPSDFKGDLDVVNSGTTFDIFGKELRMYGNKPPILTIEYNKYPKKITTSPDQIPDMPEAFHDLYIFYGAMMAMLADEEHERYMHFREQFIVSMQALKKYMDTARSSRIRHKTGAWVVIR